MREASRLPQVSVAAKDRGRFLGSMKNHRVAVAVDFVDRIAAHRRQCERPLPPAAYSDFGLGHERAGFRVQIIPPLNAVRRIFSLR